MIDVQSTDDAMTLFFIPGVFALLFVAYITFADAVRCKSPEPKDGAIDVN